MDTLTGVFIVSGLLLMLFTLSQVFLSQDSDNAQVYTQDEVCSKGFRGGKI